MKKSHALRAVPAPQSEPWYLILDRSDADDPKWVLVTVATSADVKPAELDESGCTSTDWTEISRWISQRIGDGQIAELTPLPAPKVWAIDMR